MSSSLKLSPLTERIYWGQQKNVSEFLTTQNRFLLKNLKQEIGYSIDTPVFSSTINEASYERLHRGYEQCFNTSVTKNSIDSCIRELDRLFKDAFQQKIPFKESSCDLKCVVKKMLIAKPNTPMEHICHTILHLSFVFDDKALSYEQSNLLVEKVKAKKSQINHKDEVSLQEDQALEPIEQVQKKIEEFVEFLQYKKGLCPFSSLDHLIELTKFEDKTAIKKRLVETIYQAIPGSIKYIKENLEIDLRGIVQKNIKRNPSVDFVDLYKKVGRLAQLLTNQPLDSDQVHESFKFISNCNNKTIFFPSLIDLSIQNFIFYNPDATLEEIMTHFEKVFPNPHNDLVEAKIYHIINLYLLNINKLLEDKAPLMQFMRRYKGFFAIDTIPLVFSKESTESLYLSYLIEQFEEIYAMIKSDMKRHVDEHFAAFKTNRHAFEIISHEYNDIIKKSNTLSHEEIAKELHMRFAYMSEIKRLLRPYHANLSQILQSIILKRDDLIDTADAMTLFCQKKCVECLSLHNQVTNGDIFTSIIRAYPQVTHPGIKEKIMLLSRNRFIVKAFIHQKMVLKKKFIILLKTPEILHIWLMKQLLICYAIHTIFQKLMLNHFILTGG